MLSRITATRFGRAAETGRTRPFVLFCDQEDASDEIEVYVKLRSAPQIGATGLMCEGIAALLGRDLGLPIPEPFAVKITEQFASIVQTPKDADLFRRSVGWNFGSQAQYPQFAPWSAERIMPVPMRTAAAETFAFDAMIQNPDRRHDRPNCSVRDEEILIFDHDLAFSFLSGILFWKPPWEATGLDFLAKSSPDRHVFYDQLSGMPLVLDRLTNAWNNVDASRVNDYFDSLPSNWIPAGDARRRIVDYLLDLKLHLPQTLAEVRKVLHKRRNTP